MDLLDSFRVVCSFWKLLTVSTVLGASFGAGINFVLNEPTSDPTYTASATAVILSPEAAQDLKTDFEKASRFSTSTQLFVTSNQPLTSLSQTLAVVANSELVALPAAQRVGISADKIPGSVITTVVPETEIFQITTFGESKSQADSLNAEVITQLENQIASLLPDSQITLVPLISSATDPQETGTVEEVALSAVASDPTLMVADSTVLTALLPEFSNTDNETITVSISSGSPDPTTGITQPAGTINIAATSDKPRQATESRDRILSEIADRLQDQNGDSAFLGAQMVTTSVTDESMTDPLPQPNRTLTNVILGALLGLGIGGGWVYFKTYRDSTIRTPAQYFRLADSPPLATIPDPGGEPSTRADAFRVLRSTLISANPGSTVFTFTSAEPMLDSWQVASDLAISVAQIQRSVLVVETDPHAPRCATEFHLPSSRGLSELLRGELQAKDVIHPTVNPTVSVLPVGDNTTEIPDLISSPTYARFLESIRGEFDFVFVVGAPLVNSAFAPALAKQSDATVLIVRLNDTTANDLGAAATTLNQIHATVAGVVITNVSPESTTSWARIRHGSDLAT